MLFSVEKIRRELALNLTLTRYLLQEENGAVQQLTVPVNHQAEADFCGFLPVHFEDAGRTLGASPWQRFRRLSLPLAAPGLASAVALTWVRAMGEFGIVMIFACFPQGIPVKLYNHLQDHSVDAVQVLLWLLLLVTLPLPLACFAFVRRYKRDVARPTRSGAI